MAPPELPVSTLSHNTVSLSCTPLDDLDLYCVPSYEELGLDTSKLCAEVWHGGETEALNRLDRHLERKVEVTYSCHQIYS